MSRERPLIPLLLALCTCLFTTALFAQDPLPQSDSGPVLQDLVVQGASVFSGDDIMWLLRLRKGERLPGSPEEVARQLQRRYEREGYTAARVRATFDSVAGRLTLTVEEGRIDDIDVTGLPPELAGRFRTDLATLGVRAGDVYNRRTVGGAVKQLIADSDGALRLGPRHGEGQDDIEVVDRAGRRVVVIPLTRERGRFSLTSGTSSREDLFDPVDGFSPGLGFEATAFDPSGSNHTFLAGYVSYKFGREHGGYSLGLERALSSRPRVFAGVEAHDLTASDDQWRLSTIEQTLVSVAFRNTFRDYYRRSGLQVFAGVRPRPQHELLFSARWDAHEPLQNTTDFSFFRDDHPYRPNTAIPSADLHAMVLAYTFDSRGLTDGRIAAGFERHLLDDLFRGTRRQAFGWRADWTTEIAGHGMGGDYTFERHILNARAYVPLSPRQSIATRLVAGFSGGVLPIERRFAIGGVGTVHGYRFKASVGAGMTLVNAEYRLDLGGWSHEGDSSLRALMFFDAGQVTRPIGGSTSAWLQGVGAGVQTGPFRIEVGFRLNDLPRSRQILVRLSPTF